MLRQRLVHFYFIAAVSAAGLVISLSAQQTTAPVRSGGSVTVGTGVIAGRVVSPGPQPTPVRRVMVSLHTGADTNNGLTDATRVTAASSARMVVTDDEGRFWFGNLPAGRYTIELKKAAYRSTFYGARTSRSQGLALALADGQRITDVVATIARGAIVTGRVVDQNNLPIAGALLVMLERVMINGEPVYRNPNAGSAGTDDRGVYRFYGFEAGTYIVGVSVSGSASARSTTPDELLWATRLSAAGAASSAPGPQRPVKYASVYYPGVSNAAEAVPLTFANGEERAGIDFVVSLVPTSSISGQVTRADGVAVRNAVVTVQSATSDSSPALTFGTRALVQPDGTFSADGLFPGRYTIAARAPSAAPTSLDLWALGDVTITGQDVGDVALVLQPSITVRGRAELEDTTQTAPADLANRVAITVRSAPGSPSPTAASTQSLADGQFVLTGLVPGSYVLTTSVSGSTPAHPTWVLASARAGDRDVADTPFDIRPGATFPEIVLQFSNHPTEITGSLLDQAGRPVPEYSVIAFSTNPTHWRQGSRRVLQPTRPATDGKFAILGLPPGDYYLAALTSFEPQEWYTAPFLEQVVPGAIKITVAEGEKKTQDLRLR